jgi:hypothetical protein
MTGFGEISLLPLLSFGSLYNAATQQQKNSKENGQTMSGAHKVIIVGFWVSGNACSLIFD